MKPSTFRFPGVTSPNTTQVPDQYLDELLPILSGAELKVLLYITRRTFGFKKASDNISLSQMLNGIRTRDGRQLDAGVGLTKKTLLGAIRSLEDQQIILTERQRSAEKGDEPTCYRLNIRNQATGQTTVPPVGEKLHQGGGGEIPPGPRGKNYTTQQTVEQQTGYNLSNDSKEKTPAAGENDRQKSDSPKSDNFQHSPLQTAKHAFDAPLKSLIESRAPKRHTSPDDWAAVGVIIEQFAAELGDQAPTKSSISRAMNLLASSGVSRDGFIDLMFSVKGVVQDRYRHPGKAPLPRNRMAYFFAVIEDQLGVGGTGS